ncbi:4-hydroxybenzoate octaprenyltransferase [Thermococcus kodakarensis KOD1]|uniref:4-hydroxybenzoate octaprenyltransferase n=1 Tax=Thermococcus kodakarensis (strain ATCC BAA-918 / JCM 12380 / KOD1) TaxID=69014 RepID=Q5JGT1_THEKO|nr:UbiA prenyltransferase family protein [Thermococcus kodakarensis]WCN27305.1 UbiA prenyltransferase family protein [Thermococcus kodakarensis]WCN29593.1 UbiA prenyltransferase family protein [Thermococcus kodakarensis]BAD85513.1 4-hydroxybenzoate octaprenyltransferase [Thermococcus kodakarensis KOD1]
MASVSAVIRNFRPLEGRAYIGLIGLAILMNAKWVSRDEALLAFIAGVFFVWYAFSINNCFDVDTDSLNPDKVKRNPIASGELSFWEGVAISVVLALLGTAIASRTNTLMFIFYLLMTLLATIYSAPPRLKARPVVDVLSHGLFFGGLPFLYGASMDGRISGIEALIALSVTLYSFALELRNHLGDYESDLKAGLKTTPIALGKKASETLVVVFSWASIVLLVVGFTPLGALGAVAVKLRINYRTLDALMLALLVAHTARLVLGG